MALYNCLFIKRKFLGYNELSSIVFVFFTMFMFLTDFNTTRFVCLCLICIVFAVIYVVLCDDPVDFGGIHISQDAVRSEAAELLAERRLNQFQPHESFVTHGDNRRVTRDIHRDVDSRHRSELQYQKYTLSRCFNMLYFSMSNTITMGYGDIYPLSYRAKIIVAVHMICLFLVISLRI